VHGGDAGHARPDYDDVGDSSQTTLRIARSVSDVARRRRLPRFNGNLSAENAETASAAMREQSPCRKFHPSLDGVAIALRVERGSDMASDSTRQPSTTTGSQAPDGAPSARFAPSPVLRNVKTIAELEAQSNASRTALDRLSDRVSDFASSPSFLLIHIAWFAGWVFVNVFTSKPLDPYPFTFLTFLVSLEAIFLTSFVLISQKHLERQSHRRAALDLQINLLAEQEMTSVLRAVAAIAAHLGVSIVRDDEQELTQLTESTDVIAIAKSVEEGS
jgi:uncharacterized membrane protein